MIKAKCGKVKVKGSFGSLMADLSCIIHCLYTEVLLEELSEDEAEEVIYNAVEIALGLEDEDDEEDEVSELLKELHGVMEDLGRLKELVASKQKGHGEE